MDEDAQWFSDHLDRKARIRQPAMQRHVDKQRSVRFLAECELEFRSLGPHDKTRRRILLTRIDFHGEPLPEGKVIKIPFLTFGDESIEDTDEVLLPIIRDLMLEAARRQA